MRKEGGDVKVLDQLGVGTERWHVWGLPWTDSQVASCCRAQAWGCGPRVLQRGGSLGPSLHHSLGCGSGEVLGDLLVPLQRPPVLLLFCDGEAVLCGCNGMDATRVSWALWLLFGR